MPEFEVTRYIFYRQTNTVTISAADAPRAQDKSHDTEAEFDWEDTVIVPELHDVVMVRAVGNVPPERLTPAAPTVLAENVLRLRELRGYTLRDVSKLSGVSIGTLSRTENKRGPNLLVVEALARVFGVTVAELLTPHEEAAWPRPATSP